MKNIVILDTSFIQSLRRKSDTNNSRARKLLKELPTDSTLVVPLIVAGELLTAVRNLKSAKQFIKRISHHIEPLIEKDLEIFSHLSAKKRKSLKANDCFILAICKRYDAKLLTFDKRMTSTFEEIMSR